MLRKVDAIRRRDLLDARREADGTSLGGVIHAQIVADLSDHDLAGVEPHAHGEAQAAGAAELARVARELLGQGQRGMAGALRMVLVGDRRAEQRHDAVAGELVDRALEAMDAVRQDREEPIHDAVPFFGVDALGEIHRALYVGEQHRDLLSFALERASQAEDLFGEVRGRVGARVARGAGGGCGQHRAAGVTELLLGGIFRAAALAGDDRAERGGALAAKAGACSILMAASGTTHREPRRRRRPRIPPLVFTRQTTKFGQGSPPKRMAPPGAGTVSRPVGARAGGGGGMGLSSSPPHTQCRGHPARKDCRKRKSRYLQ
jgi:hypothetical protein